MSCVILSAPGFTLSLPTLVNKTATTITVNWTPVPSDVDGYVVNVTSDTTSKGNCYQSYYINSIEYGNSTPTK